MLTSQHHFIVKPFNICDGWNKILACQRQRRHLKLDLAPQRKKQNDYATYTDNEIYHSACR